jgi:rare lipoprotein A
MKAKGGRMKEQGERRKGEGRPEAASLASPFILHTSSFILGATAMFLAAALAGCGTTPKREPSASKAPSSATAPRGGGYYLDDGPGENPPHDLDSIPDAVPKFEPPHRGASRPYSVMGRNYVPMTSLQPYKARGVATWYGRRYHGKQTSSGELYDMYAMTAAHPTLPIPSYARVTHLANGKTVVVRINDRGPFVDGRVIDLSYTAAYRLGVLGGGSAMVEVESILPGDSAPASVASVPAQPTRAAPRDPASIAMVREPDPIAVPLPAPEPQPATTTAAREIPMTSAPSGVYLQLGAFGSRENAENFLTRLRLQIDWLAERLQIFPRDGLYRVHAGPYTNQTEARQTADRIGQALGIKPVVLVR